MLNHLNVIAMDSDETTTYSSENNESSHIDDDNNFDSILFVLIDGNY